MRALKLLDLFCGAGIAAEGYANIGLEVTGVDLFPQPDYPYKFIQADASTFPLEGFDIVHASPPCQLFTRARHLRDAQGGTPRFLDLLTPTIERFQLLDVPWVIENVEAAKSLMPSAVTVCGSAFGMEIQRHRLFLSNVPIEGTVCNHKVFPIDPVSGKPRPWGIYHVPNDSIPAGGRTARNVEHGRALMRVSRPVSWQSLKEGFPADYTTYIGTQILDYLGG